jgi:hypothetical protein
LSINFLIMCAYINCLKYKKKPPLWSGVMN